MDGEEITRVPSTSGGRPIPPRSDLRTSPNHDLATPEMPVRSERRNSREGGMIAPLNVNPVARNEHDPLTPINPTSPRSKTPNLSRPNGAPPAAVGAIQPHPTPLSSHPTPTGTAQPPGKRQSLASAFKGLHGAGEALRGSVNEKIAHGMHDTAEEERMRAVREKGMGEWRGSGLNERVPPGLREGFREKAEGRMRMHRASRDGGVHGSEGPGGLQPIADETER